MAGRGMIVAAAALLGACGGPPAKEGGVATRLILLDPAPVVGKPLRVRLDLANDGPGPVIFDAQQADCNESLEVIGPDGKRAPYLAGAISTFGAFEELAGRTSRPIVEELDVASQYLVSKPGRYTIRFTGRGLGAIDASKVPSYRPGALDADEVMKAWASPLVLPSNTLAVEVGSGQAPEAMLLAERILSALPEKWNLIWEPPSTSPEPDFMLIRYGAGRSDNVWISLRVSSRAPEGGEKKEGELGGRNINMAATARAEEAWPGHRARLVAILGDGRK